MPMSLSNRSCFWAAGTQATRDFVYFQQQVSSQGLGRWLDPSMYWLVIWKYQSGWWFQTWLLFSINFHNIYGMSSFPLTNSYFSRWLLHHQPAILEILPYCMLELLHISFPTFGWRKTNPSLHCRGKNRQKNLWPIYWDSLSSFVVGKALLFMVG